MVGFGRVVAATVAVLVGVGSLTSGMSAVADDVSCAEQPGVSWCDSDEDRIADAAIANEVIELAAVAPGSLVQIVGGEKNASARQQAGFAQHAQGLDSGGGAGFHVR